MKLAVLLVLTLATSAHADKLGDARAAIDEVRYDDARRLLVEAIDAGGNSAVAMRQIYELSASTAIVLGQPELGEQYYRRWLAIDPAAKLPAGSAPKLTEAFVNAQAYADAHGRLVVTATRTAAGDQADVVVESDPLAMAVLASGNTGAVRFSERRARVGVQRDATSVPILDDHSNQLLLLPVPAAAAVVDPGPGANLPPRVDQPQPSFAGRWTTWAVPSAALLIAGSIVGGLAITKQQKLDDKLENSGQHTLSEIQHDHDTIRRNGTIAIGLAAGATLLAIPAVVLYIRQQDPSKLGAPLIQIGPMGPTSFGVSGRF